MGGVGVETRAQRLELRVERNRRGLQKQCEGERSRHRGAMVSFCAMTRPPISDRSDWMPVGTTTNTTYRAKKGAPDILIILPEVGLRDDAASARMNMAFQTEYAQKLGRRCAVIVLLGSLASQDAEARRIYGAGMKGNFYAAALVVTNPLSRAIGSFFLGLSRPPVPTKMFPDFEKAIAWAESVRPQPGAEAQP